MIKWIARHTGKLLREEWFLRVHLRSSLFKLIWFIILSLKTLFVALYWRHKLTSCHLVWYVRSIHAKLMSFSALVYILILPARKCSTFLWIVTYIDKIKGQFCLKNVFKNVLFDVLLKPNIWLIYGYPGFPRVLRGGFTKYLRVGYYFRKSVQNSTGIKKPNINAELFCKL